MCQLEGQNGGVSDCVEFGQAEKWWLNNVFFVEMAPRQGHGDDK